MGIQGTHGGYKREQDSVEMELSMVVNHHVGASSFVRTTNALNYRTISLLPTSLLSKG